MENHSKQKHLKNMIAFSFLFNVVCGMVGSGISSPGFQHLLWAMGAFFMIIGTSLLASKLTREGHDIPAAGFIVLSIAEALSYGFIATHDAGQEQFGAVVAIFVPVLILISFYDVVPLMLRIAGFLSAASFASLAIVFYSEVKSDSLYQCLILGGYMPMNVAVLGWAWLIYKKRV